MKIRGKTPGNIYTYDDAPDVLRNKLCIKDFDKLQSIERNIVYIREQAIKADTACIECDCDFSLDYLCAIHRYLFSDLYDWAGELRVTNINKRGGDIFCSVIDIRRKFDILYRELKYANYFKDIDSDEVYVGALAKYYADLNYIHPFREGNGRAQRIFVSQLCELSGRQLDFSHSDHDELIQASVAGMQQDYEPMKIWLGKMLISPQKSYKMVDCHFEETIEDDIEYLDE